MASQKQCQPQSTHNVIISCQCCLHELSALCPPSPVPVLQLILVPSVFGGSFFDKAFLYDSVSIRHPFIILNARLTYYVNHKIHTFLVSVVSMNWEFSSKQVYLDSATIAEVKRPCPKIPHCTNYPDLPYWILVQ